MKPTKEKQSEAELCADFIAWAKPQGWTAYPETAGWDILLVNSHGEQFGIQAKLRFNATLLRQSLPHRAEHSGPDFRGVLLPKIDGDIQSVAIFCGLVCFRRQAKGYQIGNDPGLPEFCPSLSESPDYDWADFWAPWYPTERCKLPDYIPDVPAGASCPTQLTQWKVGALRITALLELRGYVTRADFKLWGTDHRRWVPMEWLVIKDGFYVRGPKLRFDRQHPANYAEIKDEIKEWLKEDHPYAAP